MDFDGANAYVGLAQQLDEHPAGVVADRAARSPTRRSCATTPTSTSARAGGGRPKKSVGPARHEHRRVVVARRQQDRADAVEGRQPGDLHHQRERRLDRHAASPTTRRSTRRRRGRPTAASSRSSAIATAARRSSSCSASGGTRDAGLVQRQLQHDADVVAQGRQARHRVHHARRRQLRHRHARSRHQGDDARSPRTRATTRSRRSRRTAARSRSRAPGQGVFIANADGTGKAHEGLERLGDRRRLGPGSRAELRTACRRPRQVRRRGRDRACARARVGRLIRP